MNVRPLLLLAACTTLSLCSHAAEVYGGIGFPGLTLGYAGALDNGVTLRGEFTGGLSLARSGRREGVDFDGRLKASRVGAFADWYPFAGSFRLTGGITANTIEATLQGKGGASTINGKPVDLSGETFDVRVAYPKTTPYLGLGWGHQANQGKGLGFYADLGVQVGQFSADATTSVVGKGGITQADVDAEVAKVRDSIGKLKVLPSFGVGLRYSF